MSMILRNKINEDPHNIAITQLNIWATLSELGKHEKAASYAQSAIMLIQDEYGHGLKSVTSDGKTMDIVFSTQTRGFYNLAVELEYLKHYDESLDAYNEALNLCKTWINDERFANYIKNSIREIKVSQLFIY